MNIVRFVTRKNIHLVVDEIYAATVFAGENFVSVAEVVKDLGDSEVNADLIHIVYSLSKDMGLPGFRVWYSVFLQRLGRVMRKKDVEFRTGFVSDTAHACFDVVR